MPASTIYDLNVRLLLQDRATKQVTAPGGITDALRKLAGQQRSILDGFRGIGSAVIAGFGVRAAGGALVGFNSNMEQARIQMAGMIQLTSGGDWTGNLAKANNLVGELQLKARESVGTTEDMVQMAGMITRPILAAGLGMSDLRDMTAQSVVAAKSFGEEAGVAARDIDQALRGQFRSTDPFMSKLLGGAGYVGEEGRSKFNQMDPRKRAEEVKRALANPAIAAMAKAQGQSFEGITSTLKDNLQIAFGKIGLPLMKKISDEVKRWNTWIDANGKTLESFGRTAGQYLVDGFNAMKSAVAWVIDHREALLTIAKAFLVFKGGQMLLGAGLGIGGALSGISGFAGALNAAVPALGTFTVAVGGLTALYFGAQATADSILSALDNDRERRSEVGGASDWAMQAQKRGTVDRESMSRIVSSLSHRGFMGGGQVDQKKILEAFAVPGQLDAIKKAGVGGGVSDDFKRMLGGGMTIADARKVMGGQVNWDQAGLAAQSDEVRRALVTIAAGLVGNEQRGTRIWMDMLDQMRQITASLTPMSMAANAFITGGADKLPDAAKRTAVNVTIQRIEVKSDDADRFSFALTETFRDAVRNPSASSIRSSLRRRAR